MTHRENACVGAQRLVKTGNSGVAYEDGYYMEPPRKSNENFRDGSHIEAIIAQVN